MKALERYFRILEGEEGPKFAKADLEGIGAAAKRLVKKCRLCERRCGAKRLEGETGFCGAPGELVVSSIFPHFGEEEFLVPSLTVFFCGCTFSCAFCQNWEISRWFETGKRLGPEELASEIDRLSPGCRNVNLVGGEPTPYLPWIIETLKFVRTRLPVIWNSNFYMTAEAVEILNRVIDVYLSDWKYGNDRCAERLSGVKNYWSVVRRNHDDVFGRADLVIRHLVLPNHFSCCTEPVLKYIADNYGERVVVNIMAQYRPEYRASEHRDISRRPNKEELEKSWKLAEDLGLNWIK